MDRSNRPYNNNNNINTIVQYIYAHFLEREERERERIFIVLAESVRDGVIFWNSDGNDHRNRIDGRVESYDEVSKR